MEQQPNLAAAATRRRRRKTVLVLAPLLVLALAAGTTRPVANGVAEVQAFLEFFSGVFVLVGLTGIVVMGLLTSSRFVPITLRLLAQSAHRSLALLSMGFLAVHVTVKILEKHASVLSAVVPAADMSQRGMMICLGPVAGDLMLLAFITGIARGRFIGKGRPWAWRALHATAYVCWPVALLHGLGAGRVPKAWVTLSYVVAVVLVVLVAQVRFAADARYRRTSRPQATMITAPFPKIQERPKRRPNGKRPSRAAVPDEPPPMRLRPDEDFWAPIDRKGGTW